MRIVPVGAVIATTIMVVTALIAQEPPLSFEVASIKVNHNPPQGARAVSLRNSLSHGRLNFAAVSLRNLIQVGYNVQGDSIERCPNWGDTDWFDVIAKAEDPNATPEQARLMIRSLLADRFQLVIHSEKRNRPGYALIVSKNGSKLKVATDDEEFGLKTTAYLWTFTKIAIGGFVSFLADMARQPVVDETGLKELYDLTIDLTPSDNDPLQAHAGTPVAPDPTNGFARLSTAVDEQLGLRLEPRNVTVERLVIDKVERLSEN